MMVLSVFHKIAFEFNFVRCKATDRSAFRNSDVLGAEITDNITKFSDISSYKGQRHDRMIAWATILNKPAIFAFKNFELYHYFTFSAECFSCCVFW